MNSTSLWQRFGPFATRNYAAATYYNANGALPDAWDWLASKHLVELPYPLNSEDCRLLEDEVSRGETGEPCGSTMGRPPTQSVVVNPPTVTQTKKVPKPPPPIHPNVAGSSPSPDKSHGAFKGSPSRGSSSWDDDWHANRTQPWDWQNRRWRK